MAGRLPTSQRAHPDHDQRECTSLVYEAQRDGVPNMLTRSVATLLIGTVAAVSLSAAPALGHSPARFYPDKYDKHHRRLKVYFTTDVPGGSFEARLLDGMRQWNNVGAKFKFLPQTTPRLFAPPHRCDRFPGGKHPGGRVEYQPLPAGVAGFTPQCKQRGKNRILFFVMYLNSTEKWYSGTADAPADRTDVWSIATHEFGHGTGFVGHFPRGGSLCGNSSAQQTMCQPYFQGTERQRTLESHDVHTFNGAY